MNARGTRRPHPRRVRSKPMTRKVKSNSGCMPLMLALLGVLLVLALAAAR